MNVIKTISSVAILSVLSAGIVIFTSDKSEASIVENTECLPAVLMLRGSGESIADGAEEGSRVYYSSDDSTPYIKTNGFEGQQISRLLQPFVDYTEPSQTVSKARFVGIDYPALEVEPEYGEKETLNSFSAKTVHHAVKYHDSYNQGAKNIVNFIKADELRGCQTKYMLVGYSQGVISVRLAIDLLGNNKDKIVSTYVIGDPLNDGDIPLSSRQASPAHASSDFDGSLRTGLNTVKKFQFGDARDSTEEYLNSMTRSDEIVYRDNIDDGIYSRTICHDGDIVCDLNIGSGIASHVNYFERITSTDVSESQGDVDLEYEISAFDEQLKVLINSAPSAIQKRVLTKTPSVNTSTTLYNLANSRAGDRCSWDEGNDGSYEASDIDCGIYEYENSSKTDRMKLKVVDALGSEYFFELENEKLEVEQLEAVLHLYPNSWYQFKVKEMPLTEKDEGKGWYYDFFEEKQVFDEYWEPSFVGEQCIEWSHLPDYEIDIDSAYWNLNLNSCRSDLKDDNAFDALQVFKPSMSSNGVDRTILSGYDDNHAWDIDDIYEDMAVVPKENSTHDFYPLLSKVVDNKAYYSFRSGDKCLTAVDNDSGNTNLNAQECVYSDNQLFEAIKAEGEYGELSIERDTVSPNAPSNILLEMSNNSMYVNSFQWDKVEDRGLDTMYEVWKLNKETDEYELLEQVTEDGRSWGYDIDDLLVAGEEYSYAFRAVDLSENYSEFSYLNFTFPSNIKKPTKPILENVAPDGTSVTLTLPKYTSPDIRGVQVYDKTTYVGTFVGSSVTLDTKSNTTHNYSYRFEINDNIVSIQSNKLKVVIP